MINFNDLPSDILSMIYAINKEQERREYNGVVIKHLKGEVKIVRKTKKYSWIKCVSCAKPMNGGPHYHFCRGCFDRYINPRRKTEVWRSRPIFLKNKMPVVRGGKLVLQDRDTFRFLLCDSDEEE